MFFSALFKKRFFTKQQQNDIVAAIQNAEKATSGEIRLYIESTCKTATALERAVAVFGLLHMEKTAQRNGILLYIAMNSKKMSIYGDKGIHTIVGQTYWDDTIAKLTLHFKSNNMVQGIVEAIADIGNKLQTHFPHLDNDKNELPDTIVFGK